MPTVLVIEDDTMLQGAYATVLQKEGYEAHTANDGAEGLELAQKLYPDVILLDMLMPNMTGIEFLESYDLKKAHPRTQVVVFSNMSVPSEVKHAIALGAAKYLTKSSFTPKEIVAIIKDVLNAGEKQSAGK
jgi:DNA-binding NarL/FixJ family response regulator